MEPLEPTAGRGGFGPAMRRAAFFAAVWWLLVGGDAGAWGFGVLVIPLATATSLALAPGRPTRLRAAGLVPYVARFLVESLTGGIDVARRALHPGLPLRPGFVEMPLEIEGESPRALLAATVTMLPGTLSAEIERDRLVIHAIDAELPVVVRVRRMERLVAGLFRVAPRPAAGEPA